MRNFLVIFLLIFFLGNNAQAIDFEYYLFPQDEIGGEEVVKISPTITIVGVEVSATDIADLDFSEKFNPDLSTQDKSWKDKHPFLLFVIGFFTIIGGTLFLGWFFIKIKTRTRRPACSYSYHGKQ